MERVASVAVDIPLANLDRPFDYLVPVDLTELAVVGARVRVRFAGRLRNGFVLAVSDGPGRGDLLPLHEVVSGEPVLSPQIAELVRAVADHYAGGFSDVVRLAVPPRHATTENALPPDYPAASLAGPASGVLAGYPDGAGFLAALGQGRAPRAAWTVTPQADGSGAWAQGLLDAAAETLRSDRGAVLLVPDARELAVLADGAKKRFGTGSFVTLSADLGPATRYRAFLAAARGQVRLVLGTRAAVFAPVADLGLVALWDDGDDSYAEPRAPYHHVREVSVLRAHLAGAGLLLAARSRTAEVHRLVVSGWVRPVAFPPAETRARCAAIRVTAGDDTRLPPEVFGTIRAALASGPVLISVPRAGYQPVVVCAGCREVVCCRDCAQPLLNSPLGLRCRWCGPPGAAWRCPGCGDRRVRTPVAGVVRTAEEFGKAFPGARVLQSSGDHPLAGLDDRPALVLSTPGVEPPAPFGYAAAVILDAQAALRRPDLRAAEETLRRWLAVTALVRPAADGGTVLVAGEASERTIQALLRLDPVGFAERELADREAAGFPPAAKLVTLEGELSVLRAAVAALELPASVQVVGPFETTAESRVTLRCVLSEATDLTARLRKLRSVRAAKKATGALRVRVDPQVVG